MNFRSYNADENANGNTHAGSNAFYFVPHKSGTGKPIVRRRAPPPTSSPLDDIDSAVPVHTTPKATEMTSPDGRRPTLAVRTSTPLVELNDGSTVRTATPKPRFDPIKAFRSSFRGRQAGSEAPSVNSQRRWKGKGKAGALDEEENQKKEESRVASKAREIREWMKGRSGSDIHRSATYAGTSKQDKGDTSYATKTKQTIGGVRDLFKNRRPPQNDRGPRPGQTYEIVNRRIIETNPEKTVEISTWREHSGKGKAETDEDRMSIYYLSADEYPQDGDYANEASPKVEWRIEGSEISRIERERSQAGSTSNRHPNIRADANSPQTERQQVGRFSSRRKRSGKGESVNSPLPREGTISPSTSEKDPEPPSSKKGPSDSGIPVSSTPVENQGQRVRRNRGRHTQSPPIEKTLPPSPFHPTQSGSTISSIKSESTVEFEAILESCEPSLLHVSPILRSLGIRHVEHLRAAARLTPKTRDREVKEDALRLGMTVMEWAIFVDKIFTL
ncbi:hypothetical protein GALMADRAFT_152020 [Galerina marginata CBS 339.88]|uniref:Uncharacterized protein n=1 Tax=Galerina marginata (strain CBS 339.88) TaxID=685588 RepID=A0A067TIJ7_GALM3|nr:hypothetical protein GALMADRAFT_152020 [Galerina marginata CBS 339.88]